MIKSPRIAPSILAADFSRLGEQIAVVEPHVDLLHIDVMDGHFVPNISLGIPVIRSIREKSDLTFDCHLMTLNPDAYLEPLRDAGADIATVHIEVFPDPTYVAAAAKEVRLQFGLVVNPPTPIEGIEPFVELCDMVLIMSVNPGFGGQAFMPEALPKLEQVRKLVDSQGLSTDIEVDGGIDPETAARARAAGADVFVAGTSIFGAPDPVEAIADLRSALHTQG